jgi:hypothetical protein
VKRVWKPLDVGGLRLYQVIIMFHNNPKLNQKLIVAAKKPSHAEQLIRDMHKETMWIEEPVIFGKALNVYMPESWWEDGIPDQL